MDSTPFRDRPRDAVGFTLIEAVVVVAIVGVLAATAAPSFARLLSGHRAASAVNDLVHAIALARGEALKRNRRVYLAPRGTRWRDGWAVFVDRNDDRTYDDASSPTPDETILVHDALPASVSITRADPAAQQPLLDNGSPRRAYLMFDGTGYARQRNGALHFGSLVVVDRAGATTTRTLCIAAYGRVRVVVDRVGC